MTSERILELLKRAGLNSRSAAPMTVVFHVALIVGLILGGVLMSRSVKPEPLPLLASSPNLTAFEYVVEPTDPAGVAADRLQVGSDAVDIVWVGGSPLNIGAAGAEESWTNLAAMVGGSVAEQSGQQIQITSVQLQASGFGDTFVAANAALDASPDLLVLEANAVWFGNDLVTNRYPYLSDDLLSYTATNPRLVPLGLGSTDPGDLLLKTMSWILPPTEDFIETPAFARAVETGVDVVGVDTEVSAAAAPLPAEGLDTYWQFGVADFGLFWDRVGIQWRDRSAETGGRLRDGDGVANALFLSLVDRAVEEEVPLYAYINPVDVDDEFVPFVRQKEAVLLGIDNGEQSPLFSTPSQFLNGEFPAMTFRDPNHVDNPGGMVEFLAGDVCRHGVRVGVLVGDCAG